MIIQDSPSHPNSVSTSRGAVSLRKRILLFLSVMGPGLIVMMGDNDAGGIDTYSQAGQNYGISLLWVLLLLLPVLIVNQEMVVRLGAITGVGHAKLITKRYGIWWGWFSAGDLFLLNFLTIVTEFIGIVLVANYFRLPCIIVVPLAVVSLIAIVCTGNFRRWERVMFVFIAIAVVQIPMLFLAKPGFGPIIYHLLTPSIQGGISNDAILLIIAMVGTTVAPWQLFFQQSNIVDKNIRADKIKYARLDTYLGAVVLSIGAISLIVTAHYAAISTHSSGAFENAGSIAKLLHHANPILGNIFALVLLDASIIGAAAISLSTSYAFGDVFGSPHSLHKKFTEAKSFYISYALMVILSGAIVLIPHAPLGLITTLVQALAGLLLPSASVFLLLLCNDKNILGPWVNKLWLNSLAGIIIVVLLDLSAILMISTIFPAADVITIAIIVATVSVLLCLCAIAFYLYVYRRSQQSHKAIGANNDFVDPLQWQMADIDTLEPVVWNYGTRLALYTLRGYLIFGAILLVIKGIYIA